MDNTSKTVQLESLLIRCRYDRKVLTKELKQAIGILQAVSDSPSTNVMMKNIIDKFLKGVQVND